MTPPPPRLLAAGGTTQRPSPGFSRGAEPAVPAALDVAAVVAQRESGASDIRRGTGAAREPCASVVRVEEGWGFDECAGAEMSGRWSFSFVYKRWKQGGSESTRAGDGRWCTFSIVVCSLV